MSVNMSEEEDCDDLPPITVNSSANNSSTFAMPTAEELAEQRARERECERQLELLRQRHDDEQLAALRRSDSSGSEAEHALAAAVTALRVRAQPPAAAHELPAHALWAALAPRLPPHAAQLHWSAPAAQLQRAVQAVGAALAAQAAWPDDELLCAGALLSVAALAHESRCRRAAARALHALLDEHATPAQVSQLTGLLLPTQPPRARLALGDALRSGGGGGADRAAFALTAAAMLELLRAPAQDCEEWEAMSLERVARAASAWRACDADTRYVCVQLAGRLLAATSGATDGASGATVGLSGAAAGASGAPDARARLLSHLAPPPSGASDAQRPDRLKALVGASKLKLLFCVKNGVSRQPRAQRDSST